MLIHGSLAAPAPGGEFKEEEVDWGADEEEWDPKVDQDLDEIMHNVAKDPIVNAEILQRFMVLMQEQRLQTQALLAKESNRAMSQAFNNQLLVTLLGPCFQDVLPLLDQVSPAAIMNICDHNGLTLLHHACRLGLPAIVTRVLEMNKHLCDVVTKVDGKPPNWTPLMVLVDKWQDTADFRECMRQLLAVCSPTAYVMRAVTGQTPFHISASRGQWYVVKRLCWGLYHAAGQDQQAFAMVESVLNSPGGGRNAGVVDHAFRSNAALGFWLQKNWGGRPQEEPPAPENRGYTYAYRSQPYGRG